MGSRSRLRAGEGGGELREGMVGVDMLEKGTSVAEERISFTEVTDRVLRYLLGFYLALDEKNK